MTIKYLEQRVIGREGFQVTYSAIVEHATVYERNGIVDEREREKIEIVDK